MADLQRIQFKRTETGNKAPTAAQIAEGELALNLKDRAIYSKDSGGRIVNLSNPVKHDGDQTRTGQMRLTTAYAATEQKAQIFHDVQGGAAGRPATIRSMREHNSSSWVWEQVVNGKLIYSTGINPSTATKRVALNAESGEIVTYGNNGIRVVGNKFGAVFRNDGDEMCILATNANDQEGNYNNLRPFRINMVNGVVTMSHGAVISQTLAANSIHASAAIRMYNSTARQGFVLSANANGYAELVHVTNPDDANAGFEWGNGLRNYGGSDWRVGTQKLYGQHNKPTAAELNLDAKGQVWINDRRDHPAAPNDFPQRALTTWFDNKNVPSNGWYSGINVKGWEGNTYASWQLFSSATAAASDNRLYFRGSNADGTAWNATYEIYHQGRKPTADELGVVSNSRLVGDSSSWAEIINKIPYVHSNGVLSIGKYIDFHDTNSTKDYDVRLNANGAEGSESIAVHTKNGTIEIGAKNTSYAHIYTDRPQFALNKPIITLSGNPEFREANSLILQGNGRKHIRFDNALGNVDGYIWKDPGQAWRINHGNQASSEMQWTQNGELIVDGQRWAVTHSHGYNGQPNSYAPVHVNFGHVNGGSDYYPIVRGTSIANGYGYTTAVDLGVLRTGNGRWGDGILRVASHESASHPSANYSFSIEGDFTAPRNGNFNDVYIRSDSRLKINLERFENASDKLRQLTVYTYDKLAELGSERVVGREIGIIAQDLRKIVKEAVNVSDDENQLHTISNSAVNAVLIKAVQEILDRLDAIESRI